MCSKTYWWHYVWLNNIVEMLVPDFLDAGHSKCEIFQDAGEYLMWALRTAVVCHWFACICSLRNSNKSNCAFSIASSYHLHVSWQCLCVTHDAVHLNPHVVGLQIIRFRPKEVGNHRRVRPTVWQWCLAWLMLFSKKYKPITPPA